MPIASITKLMTAMVVLDSKAPMTEQIEVTDEDRDYDKNTRSRLSVGSVLSREDMLHIALMASENRAAAALSRYFPGGRPAFMAAMNEKAKQLGMLDTHFENPDRPHQPERFQRARPCEDGQCRLSVSDDPPLLDGSKL